MGAIRNPNKTIKKHGKYYLQKKIDRGIMELPCERTKKHIKVITGVLAIMEIIYDKGADAIYIRFSEGKFAKNKKIDDFTIIDLDSNENILGIELLDFSKRIPLESLSEVNVKNLLPISE